MATFTASVPVNATFAGEHFKGPAGTIFRLPDSLVPEFEPFAIQAIPGFAWVKVDEVGSLDTRVTVLEQGGGGEHPNLASHDTMGLATQTELDGHEIAPDPHGIYALDSDLTGHAAAPDPHPGYQRESEKGLANGYASLDATGVVPDAQIPASIARDSELPDLPGHVAAGDPHPAYALDTDLTAHGGAADPHTGYRLESADHGHGSSGLQGGLVAHSALSGLSSGDDHPQYQRETEKGAASGYASLDAGTLVPAGQLGTTAPDGTKFLRDDRVWATPTGAPTPDARLTTKVMATDQADITGITLVELTALTVAALAAGTYQFCYMIIYQTTATTTGVEFVVNSLATVDRFVSNMNFGSTGGAAATGIADQVGTGTAAGLMETKTARANNTRPGVTIGVDTANADMLMVIEGVIRTTTAGDLKLMMAAELAALVCRARAGSSLVLTKVS